MAVKDRFFEVFPLAKTAYRRANGGPSAPGRAGTERSGNAPERGGNEEEWPGTTGRWPMVATRCPGVFLVVRDAFRRYGRRGSC